MKIIINASTNRAGGGLQIAVSFIHECINFEQHQYFVFINDSIRNEINTLTYPSNFKFYNIPKLKFFQYNKYLSFLEKEIKADIVFSIFGPTYWRPKSPHLMGFAMGHYIYPDSPYWQNISLKEKLLWTIKKRIHLLFFRRDADEFIVETKDVATRLQKIIPKKCYVVSNTCNQVFYSYNEQEKTKLILQPSHKDEYRLLSVCTPYPHKNLQIIPRVLDEFSKISKIKLVFVLTINEDEYHKLFSNTYRDNIICIGRVRISDLPNLYSECNFAFVPSLLECFTANFPEAMIMKKPILTANLGYAKTICNNAAIYFDPLSPKDIAVKIINLINDKDAQNDLIERGQERIKFFNTTSQRARLYIKILENINKSHVNF